MAAAVGDSMGPGGSCDVEGEQQGCGKGRGSVAGALGRPLVGRAGAVLTPTCCPSRVVSDHCYPFSGREQNEAGCMMHSRAMGRGKRQATARCPNHLVHANDIYQVTPAYRLGSSVSLYLGEEAEEESWKAGQRLEPHP